MDSIVDLILQGSTTFDAPSVVRLIAFCVALEFGATICGLIGGMKK